MAAMIRSTITSAMIVNGSTLWLITYPEGS